MKRYFLVAAALFIASLWLPHAAAAGGKKLAIIGSSTFAAFCGSYNYDEELENALTESVVDCHAKVGATAEYFLDTYNSEVKGEGYTDLVVYAGLNGLNSPAGLLNTRDWLTEIFKSAQADGTRVIVVGAQPFQGYSTWTQTWGDNLKENHAWLAGKPHGVDAFIDVTPFVDKNNDGALDSEYASGDKLHLNASGQKLVYQLILDYGFGENSADGGAAGFAALSEDEIKELLRQPVLKIKIPGLFFSGINPDSLKKDLDGAIYLYFPFIGEYVSGIYRYLILAATIVVATMLIVAGFNWILSGGGEGITAAKTKIRNALSGLLLLILSYAILYLVNPELVTFRNLRVRYIPASPTGSFDKGEPPSPAAGTSAPQALAYTGYDALFQSYQPCLEVDWRLLKAMAFIESGFRSDVVNSSGFTGLFQTKKPNCESTLRKYPDNLKKVCSDLKHPEVSTMVGASMMRSSIEKIKKRCGQIELDSLYYFAYIGHHNGIGALDKILKDTCSYTEAYASMHRFWNRGKTADNSGAKRTATVIAKEGDNAGKKMIKYAQSLGVTSGFIPGNKTQCPLDNSSIRF